VSHREAPLQRVGACDLTHSRGAVPGWAIRRRNGAGNFHHANMPPESGKKAEGLAASLDPWK
jgi:hypothetical protein